MEILRNKEFRRMLTAMALITLGAVLWVYALYPAAAAITAAACLALDGLLVLFTGRRYRQIGYLADYLKRVNEGAYALEPAGHDEGELSILKSEIYKVTVALRTQNDRLAQDKLYLADTLSDISHQLKTPLTSMSVLIDLLAREDLREEKRREFTLRLSQQLERLIWLTNALLKLSRLDAQAVNFHLQPVSLQDLVHRACESLLIPMELKEQTLTVRAEGRACCDLNWTAEALSNILKNCMEHTPLAGEIRVLTSENALFSEIRVCDGGGGIDKADLPHVFQRFYRGKNAAADSVGIGLALSKSILEGQGGSVEAGNVRGGGAVFTLRLPRP
jgi:signal transduction histidine kinase